MALRRSPMPAPSKPMARMSAAKRAERAEAGDVNPFSTLTAGSALARKPMLRTAAPVKRPRPVYTGPDKATIAALEIRCGGFCEFPGCPRPAQDPHHRDERGQGGRGPKAPDWINKLSNLLAACRQHNEWASNGSPAEARAMGWLIGMGHATPYTTPVLTRHDPHKVWLDDAGGWHTKRPCADPLHGGDGGACPACGDVSHPIPDSPAPPMPTPPWETPDFTDAA